MLSVFNDTINILSILNDVVTIPHPIKVDDEVIAVDYEGRYLLSEDEDVIITEDNKIINLYRNGR